MNKFFFIMVCVLLWASHTLAYAQSTYEQLIAQTHIKHIATSVEWRNLLHYEDESSVIQGSSDFFLSENGNTDPQSELEKTIYGFLDRSALNNNHAICRYPARWQYLRKALQFDAKNFPSPQCNAYNEYLTKVPFDNVSIVFASESPVSPSTMMGHTFIKISGDANGTERQHAFSYFAKAGNTASMSFYIKAFASGAEGSYALSPYQAKEAYYIHDENRSLWEFPVKLSKGELSRLRSHLWELKSKNIEYSLISHNCNTAIINILKVANPNLDMPRSKPFTTPVEYIQYLDNKNRLSDANLFPTQFTAAKIARGKVGSVLNSPKPSRLALSFEHHKNNYMNLEVSPVYQDLRDFVDDYSVGMESKMLEADLGYNLNQNKLFVRRIDLLRLNSLQDRSISNQFSKSFRLAFETDLRNDNSDLKPTVEAGIGWSYSIHNILFHAVPKIGYRHSKTDNFYLLPDIGFSYQYKDKWKFMAGHMPYIDLNVSNRGFKNKSYIYTSHMLNQSSDLFFNYNRYSNSQSDDQFTSGVAVHF